ncbi:chromosome partitioning protein ParB [Xenorhabdus khoisanae]|uniref:Chromosome partitioning protein ParB n=1 Tax=Xenorhabdus khoisanae TaxID=880157 RepID=A0A0J5FYE3_9GAMM|nr:ParB family protein [Xenorhabdus khoisanae]KMJ46952.1 chromosome partitioning protein ParB [Xenorhabdus khoisanae]
MQDKKRPTIGRTFNSVSLDTPAENQTTEQRFTLASGQTAIFQLEHIPADKLESETTVNFLVNGRDQSALTKESVSDIMRTINLQQFFPAIGRRIDGKIEILDGSRRRAAAIFCGVGLDTLVTNTNISADDARQLAADIQTAREHNIREVGLRLLQLREGGMTQKEIAESNNMSQTKVTRAIQCASVPNDIVAVFPVIAELSYPDYKALLDVTVDIKKNNLSIDEVVSCVCDEVQHMDKSKPVAPDEMKSNIIRLFKKFSSNKAKKSTAEKQQVSPLWNFKDKDSFARKRVKNRAVSFEFNRVPKEFEEELEKMVQVLMRKHFNLNE